MSIDPKSPKGVIVVACAQIAVRPGDTLGDSADRILAALDEAGYACVERSVIEQARVMAAMDLVAEFRTALAAGRIEPEFARRILREMGDGR